MKNVTFIILLIAGFMLSACKTTGIGMHSPEAATAKQIFATNCRIGIAYNRGHDAPGRLENIRAMKEDDNIIVNRITQEIDGWTVADITAPSRSFRGNLYYNLGENTAVCGYENWKKIQSNRLKRGFNIKWPQDYVATPSRSNDSKTNTVINGKKAVDEHKKPYIVILTNDIVEHGGMPKFKVKSGDILEIVNDKMCLDGYSVCLKVRNPETGEFGFVTEERMKSRHRIIDDNNSSSKVDNNKNNSITNSAINAFKKYSTKPLNRAFAQAPTGPWGYQTDASSIDLAKSAALMRCQTHNERHESSSPCEIVHVNNEWMKK